MEDSTIETEARILNTRRSALKGAAALLALGTLPVTTSGPAVEASSVNSPPPIEAGKEDVSLWGQILRLSSEVKEISRGGRFDDAAKNIDQNIQTAQGVHFQKVAQVEELWRLALEDKDDQGQPRFLREQRKFIAGLTTLDLNKDNPLAELKEAVVSQPDFILNILKIIRDRTNEGIKDDTLDYLYKLLNDPMNIYVGALPGERASERLGKQQVSIKTSEDVELTPEGRKLFGRHAQRIGSFLERYPYYKKLYSEVVLISFKYGKLKNTLSDSGTFSTGRAEGDIERNVIVVNMDHASQDSDYWPEVVFAHEAFGHGTDVVLSVDLAARLTPEDYIERLVFQQEILNNPDWGAQEKDIFQLFAKVPVLERDNRFITSGGLVGIKEFMGIITEYPRNIILHNSYPPGSNGNKPVSLCDWVVGYPQEEHPKNQPRPRIGADKSYRNLEDFLVDYMPKLEKDSSTGNIRSRLILWGIKNFKEELGNLKGIWSNGYWDDTKKKYESYVPNLQYDSADTWSNYCNFIIINAVLYHGFINGVQEIRSMFSEQEQKILDRRIYTLRKLYRQELFAGGTAYSYFLGERMLEKPPYRVGLEHIADMINKNS